AEKADALAARAGAEAVLRPAFDHIDDVDGPVALASDKQFVTAERHIHRLAADLDRGLLPEGGVDEAHGAAVEAGDDDETIIGRIARDLRRLGYAFQAHLVTPAADCGIDQEQRGLRIVDPHDRRAVRGDRDAGEWARRLDFAEQLASR